VCHPNARCENMVGSFRCRCDRGFIGDGVDCCISEVDLDAAVEAGLPIEESDKPGSGSSRSKSKSHDKSPGIRTQRLFMNIFLIL